MGQYSFLTLCENSQRKELGKSSVAVYEESGLLSENVIFFHGTMLSDDGIIRLKDKNVHLVHCPESNLTTLSGIAPISKCLREGVIFLLGNDEIFLSIIEKKFSNEGI
jgi:5-methylthioadenosine/S-adenosylhomocysteine deaminase